MIQGQPHGSCPDGDRRSETGLANVANGGNNFRSLAETFADWIWEVDTSGAYTQIGPRARDILGYEPQELIGKPSFNLMPTAEAVRARAAFEAFVQQRKPFARLENAVMSRSGQKVLAGRPRVSVRNCPAHIKNRRSPSTAEWRVGYGSVARVVNEPAGAPQRHKT